MSKPILVTSYSRPDLDGFGGAWGYAELLKHQGKHAVAQFFDTPRGEERYVMDMFGGLYPPTVPNDVEFDQVILVDASDMGGLDGLLTPNKVIEVIDHRPVHTADTMFPNASVQIEPVGAAATLVAERIKKAGMNPDKLTAALVLGGIISNTLNFKANVTTDRDRAMRDWLTPIAGVTDAFAMHLFEGKSDLEGAKLHERFMGESALFELAGKRVMISQIELVGAEALVANHKTAILNELHDQATKKSADYYVLSLIDVGDGYNLFVTDHEPTQDLVSQALDVQFSDSLARRDGLIMRKEIVPKLKTYLEAL